MIIKMMILTVIIISNYWTRFEQNIVICHWRADQLFAEAEGCETLTNHDILR